MNAGSPPNVARRPVITFAHVVLVSLVLFATWWNWNKAYHIDDTAYLETAQWIAAHPLHPMQGIVHWADLPGPIHEINQPHLYFYVMAAWASMFGWTEASMHALMALCSGIGIVALYRIAQRVVPRAALFATSLVAASPAWITSQNTMVDVPLLALWLLFFMVLLDADVRNERTRYGLAGALCGAAVLVKYTGLVLVVVLIVDGCLRRRRAAWNGVLVAGGMIVAWCAFNAWDYGGVHMLTRRTAQQAWRVLDPRIWLLCLGAAAPFAPAFAMTWVDPARAGLRRAVGACVAAVSGGVIALLVGGSTGIIDASWVNAVLVAYFVASGLLMVVVALRAVPFRQWRAPQRAHASWILATWVSGAAAFIVLLAPFIAMRHVLLALPPVVLLAVKASEGRLTVAWKAAAVSAVVASSIVVAAADDWYAEIYRVQARALRAELPADARVWTVGHWGWQWYAREAGMSQIVSGQALPAPGDFIVYPERIHHQPVPPEVQVVNEKVVAIQRASWVTYFASTNAGFYATPVFPGLPWGIFPEPMEYFRVERVVGAGG